MNLQKYIFSAQNQMKMIEVSASLNSEGLDYQ